MLSKIGHGARVPFRERNRMKTHSDTGRRGLHLVTSAATAKALEDKFAYQVAEGALTAQNSAGCAR